MQDRGPAAYIAEFIGTLFLTFFITAAVSLYVSQPTPQNPNPFIDFSVIGLVHLLALFVLIQTLALISGAHFNPAVTVALTAIRQIKPPDAAVYVVAQLAGGVAGALLTKALLSDEGSAVHYGAPAVSDRLDGHIFPGLVAEAIGTFILVWAIVGVAVNERASKEWAGFAIGGALGLAVMVIGPLTGGSFNPARAFGPALVGHEFGGVDTFLLVYVVGPAVGGLLAAFVFVQVLMAPGKKGPEGLEPVG